MRETGLQSLGFPAEFLRRGVANTPNSIALQSTTHRLTWQELDTASTVLATSLLSLGLVPGDRVASLMPNRVVLLVHYLACLKAGLVITPLNYRYVPREIDHALELSGASILLVHAERKPDLAESTRAGALPFGSIACEDPDSSGLSIEALVRGEATAARLATPDSESPALIFFTSGSTGAPKGVTLSRRAVEARARAIAGGLGIEPGMRVLPSLSLAHGGAFDLSMAALSAGGTTLVPHSNEPGDILPLLRQGRPRYMLALPSTLFALVRDCSATRADFASVTYCGSGGDVVPEELAKEVAQRAGLDLRIGYGMTEIGIATCNRPGTENRHGSVGIPNPSYDLAIRGHDDCEAAAGIDGRLWVHSPANMTEYWKDPKETEAVFRDGWLDTGDIMMRDADGYLWFRGRQKQIIVHDGSNIWPQEVEAALLEHPSVAAAGVVGVRDEVHGDDVKAYVAMKPDLPRPTAAELIDFARARIGYKAPEDIVFLDQIPLNSGGKIDRVLLKRMAAAAQNGERKP